MHALSRCQMILTEAKKRAQREFDQALETSGLTLDAARARQGAEMHRATWRLPQRDACGTAANAVLHVAARAGASA